MQGQIETVVALLHIDPNEKKIKLQHIHERRHHEKQAYGRPSFPTFNAA